MVLCMRGIGIDVSLIGVQVGGQYESTLLKNYSEEGINFTVVKSSYDYYNTMKTIKSVTFKLDPIYEAAHEKRTSIRCT